MCSDVVERWWEYGAFIERCEWVAWCYSRYYECYYGCVMYGGERARDAWNAHTASLSHTSEGLPTRLEVIQISGPLYLPAGEVSVCVMVLLRSSSKASIIPSTLLIYTHIHPSITITHSYTPQHSQSQVYVFDTHTVLVISCYWLHLQSNNKVPPTQHPPTHSSIP
jgi:hypothetical protein